MGGLRLLRTEAGCVSNRFFKLDTRILNNPKIRRVGPEGFTLYVGCCAESNENLWDGFIDDTMVDVMAAKAMVDFKTFQILVDHGLFEREENGYRIHDYFEWNRSAEQISELNEKRRNAANMRWQSDEESKSVAKAMQSASNMQSKIDAKGSTEQEHRTRTRTIETSPNGDVVEILPGQVTKVWEAYRQTVEKTCARGANIRLAPQKDLIRRRIAKYGFETVMAAVTGWQYDDWPDRFTKWAGLKHILRPENIESFAEMAVHGPPPAPIAESTAPLDRRFAAMKAKLAADRGTVITALEIGAQS